MARYTLDQTATCPCCGAKALVGGELTFERRKGGFKWFGPYLEFECGLMIVSPRGDHATATQEVWNPCKENPSGRRIIDVDAVVSEPKEDLPALDYFTSSDANAARIRLEARAKERAKDEHEKSRL